MMSAAKNGSETETRRSTLAPSAMTAGSGVKMPMKNAGYRNRNRLSADISVTAIRMTAIE